MRHRQAMKSRSYRGFKALTAERMGAAAILIYSYPAEDGYKKGKVFPDGPWGPESHIQRGAITYDFLIAGDPLTPGWASLPGARRVPIEEARSVPKIIAVPLSWRDAKPLLENMDGPMAPKSWQGGLPIKYRLGGGRVRVHVKADMDTAVRTYYVTEARTRGSEFPDEWVVLGNHRDAWVLRERFDEEWFRNDRTGPFLVALWRQGQRYTLEELATDLGLGPPSIDPLLTQIAADLA